MPALLLVEDEQALGLIVKDSLETRGFTVWYATGGEEGPRLFREKRPDAVVADVMMPNLDGACRLSTCGGLATSSFCSATRRRLRVLKALGCSSFWSVAAPVRIICGGAPAPQPQKNQPL
jgi:ActR/RegA family two-component response regulator